MTVINDIILEGFKSYSTKTIFSNLNSKFNSITGTNGSGKSNILDGICFALGLANLNIIRAGTLDDLIYKNEKTKNEFASVSLILKDRNFSKKLFGFIDTDKISITRKIINGGKNKYFLNGENVNPGKILNFLYSINININNPHFFIRQGHITRIAKMNSNELLQTVESAFGIKLYATKKKNALTLINKKSDKVEEINFILINKIRPLLNKIGHSDFTISNLELIKNKNQSWASSISITIKIEKNISAYLKKKFRKKKFKETISSTNNKKFIDRLLSKILIYVKIFNTFNFFLKKNSSEVFSSMFHEIKLNEKVSKILLLKILENYKNQRKFSAKYRKIISRKQKNFFLHRINSLFDKYREEKSIFEKFEEKKNQIYNFMGKLSSSLIFINHFFIILLSKTIFKKKNFFQYLFVFRKEYMKRKIFFLKKNPKVLHRKNRDIYENDKKTWREIIKKIYKKIERFFGNEKIIFWKLRFSIFGNLGSLIVIKNSFLTTALELANPSRLKMIILDTNINSKKILDLCDLKKKTSIIPLSEILVSDKNCVENISNFSLINYVGYKSIVSKSLRFVFDHFYLTLSAKNLTNSKEHSVTKYKKITPDGDIFESQGSVITGKNVENGFSFLTIFSEFNHQKIYFSRIGTISRKYFIKKKNFNFSFYKKSKIITKRFEKFLKMFPSEIFFSSNLRKKKKFDYFLRKLICSEKFSSNQTFLMRRGKGKKFKEKINKKLLILEEKNINMANNSNYGANFILLLSFQVLMKDIFITKCFFYKIFYFSKKFFFLSNLKKFLFDILPLKILFIQKKLRKIRENFFLDTSEYFSKKNIKSHENPEKNHSMIKKKLVFYFKNIIEEKRSLIRKIFSILSKLKKKNSFKILGKKSLNFLLEGGVQYRELIRKRIMIEKDRLIIEHIIKQLDVKKNKIVVRSIRKVNMAFQAIFSMLLPGSLGKLVLIRNFNKVLHGIDFRIKSGETHSETLEELSGGQKSIIALSFIFSLLLSKPAPFYILDEIDAALDLCHTQNIGKIIREYFPMSQFLVVSLKNGIITKANLIFKIKNIRGKSVITRITNKDCND
jgi:structural maintenance of chromosome 2